MARRDPDKSKRFIANTSPSHLEVHDLDNEKYSCQIDELMKGGNYQFLPNNTEEGLANWLKEHSNYDGCYWCLPKYHRK